MYDYSERRITKLFDSIIAEINKTAGEDDALTTGEIISALSEVVLTINAMNLQSERESRNALN